MNRIQNYGMANTNYFKLKNSPNFKSIEPNNEGSDLIKDLMNLEKC